MHIVAASWLVCGVSLVKRDVPLLGVAVSWLVCGV